MTPPMTEGRKQAVADIARVRAEDAVTAVERSADELQGIIGECARLMRQAGLVITALQAERAELLARNRALIVENASVKLRAESLEHAALLGQRA